jgi:hypothetical protein
MSTKCIRPDTNTAGGIPDDRWLHANPNNMKLTTNDQSIG